MVSRGSSDLSHLLPDYIELLTSQEYGRGIYAKRPILAGTHIITGQPLAHVISCNERGLCCDWCLSKERSLLKCSKCKFVWYCSRNCQRHDWTYHKMECEGVARISPQIPTDTVRLIMRLLVVKNLGINTLVLPSGVDWELDLLTTNAPRYNVELKESLSHQVVGVKLISKNDVNLELAFEIACKLISNSFSILDWEMNSIGSGVYVIPALFNHSCDPNVMALFDGKNMKLRAIRNIQTNEQLFVSYTDLLETRERRQKHLYKYYMFTCNCNRCSCEMKGSQDELLIQTVKDLNSSEIKTLYKEGFKEIDEAEKLKKIGNWSLLADKTNTYLKANLETLGDNNILTVKMRECLMDAYIETQQWEEALKVARLLQGPYNLYYSQMNPFIGLHSYKMAKLMHQVTDTNESLKESQSLLDKAIGILTVTHGSDHKCVVECKGLLYEVGMELNSREEKWGNN